MDNKQLPERLDYGLILGLGYPVGPVNLNPGCAHSTSRP